MSTPVENSRPTDPVTRQDTSATQRSAPPTDIPDAPPPAYKDIYVVPPQRVTVASAHIPPPGPQGIAQALPPPQPGTAPPIYRNQGGEPVNYVIREDWVVVHSKAPLLMYCPYDRTWVTTDVAKKPGAVAWLCSAFLCFVCWPCFWLPCCLPSCMDRVHYCPTCGNVLAHVPA